MISAVFSFFSSFPLGAFSSGLSILVVIDTNIMISHLEFVRSLKSEDIPGMSICSNECDIVRKTDAVRASGYLKETKPGLLKKAAGFVQRQKAHT